MLICVVVILLTIWLEPELVKTALSPLVDILLCLIFAMMFIVLALLELTLIVIAPMMLFLGIESRRWHVSIIDKTFKFIGRLGSGSKRTL